MLQLDLEQVLLALVVHQTVTHMPITHYHRLAHRNYVLRKSSPALQQQLLPPLELVVSQHHLVIVSLLHTSYLKDLHLLSLHQFIYNMKNTLPKIIFRYSQTQKIPLSLAYPYEYTLTANEFAFVDVRFTEVPFSKELWKHEKEHVQTVLSRFQQILNGQKQKLEIDQYIQPCLRSKAEELLSIQK